MKKLRFLYEDSSIFAVFKPWGIHSVPAGQRKKESSSQEALSIAELLIEANPALRHVSKTPSDGGLLNRLDLMTSGILLGAKSSTVWAKVHQLYLSHLITKRYFAIVEGQALMKDLTLEHRLIAKGRQSKRVRAEPLHSRTKGRSVAQVKSLLTGLSYHRDTDISLVQVETKTGARHQVRAQLAAIGFPLVGDLLYGAKKNLSEVDPFFKNRQFYLLAVSVGLDLDGRKIEVVCPQELYGLGGEDLGGRGLFQDIINK